MPAVHRSSRDRSRPGRRWRRWAVPVVLALAAGACAADTDTDTTETGGPAPAREAPASEEPVGEELAWPGDDWPEATPEEADLDPAALEEMAAAAEAGGSQCLVVTRDGEMVGEWYWGDFDEASRREVFSVSKSITSTLVGIAQDRGLLDIEQPASDFIEEWRGTPSEDVTIRNLLSNDSGRFQSFESDYRVLAGQAEDKTAYAVGLDQEHEPGTKWVYNNAAIQALDAVLEEAVGMPVTEFAEQELFAPLGMGAEIKADATGNALMFMGVDASCRDLARFGLLFERDGEWDGEQVVSPEWVAEATSPSTELNPDYGLLWWLSRDDPELPAEAAGMEVFAGLGLQNQTVAVFPEHGIVVSRLGAATGQDGESAFGYGHIIDGVARAAGVATDADGDDAEDSARDAVEATPDAEGEADAPAEG
jgi:CubicO group peptidase (beta-lactamase class C family)